MHYHYETWSGWPAHKQVIFPEYQPEWIIIVEFLLKTYFWDWVNFFYSVSTLYIKRNQVFFYSLLIQRSRRRKIIRESITDFVSFKCFLEFLHFIEINFPVEKKIDFNFPSWFSVSTIKFLKSSVCSSLTFSYWINHTSISSAN